MAQVGQARDSKTVWVEKEAGKFAAFPGSWDELIKQYGRPTMHGAGWEPTTKIPWSGGGGRVAGTSTARNQFDTGPSEYEQELRRLREQEEARRRERERQEAEARAGMNQLLSQREGQIGAYKGWMEQQPSYVDVLQGYREQYGLPEKEQQLKGLVQQTLDVETLLDKLEQDINERISGKAVSEPQRRALLGAQERPLREQLADLLRAEERAGAGLGEARTSIEQLMGAQSTQRELERMQYTEPLGYGAETFGMYGQLSAADRAALEGIYGRQRQDIGQAEQLYRNRIAQQMEVSSYRTPEQLAEIERTNQQYLMQLQSKLSREEMAEGHNYKVALQKMQQGFALEKLSGEEVPEVDKMKGKIRKEVEGVTQWQAGTPGFREGLIASLRGHYGEALGDYIHNQVYSLIPDPEKVKPPEAVGADMTFEQKMEAALGGY